MNFINPLVLFGLFAAAIPVLLHLLNLRKLKTVEFSSLKFLKELQKTKIRKIKLKQILLLILRTLLIIFAVLAFARPSIPGSIPFFESYSKTSAIVLIDNSLSMDISDEYGNRFKQSKNAVRSILENLREGDEIALVPMSGENFNTPVFTRNFEYANENINNIAISLTPSNLNRSIRIAESLINDAANLNKEIYIISDGQANTFNLLHNDTVRLKSELSSAIYVPIGLNSNADLQNLSIDSAKVKSAIFQQDKLVEVEVYVRNSSKNLIKDVVVSLKFNDKSVAQRSADLNAGETRSYSIAAIPSESGNIRAVVELEGDIQDRDNSRYFGFNIPPKPRLLVAVNSLTNIFIKSALSSLSADENQSNIRYILSDRLSSEDFSNYDAVVLTGGKIDKNDFNRLSQYIYSGGKILTFANSDSDFNLFSGFLKSNGIGLIKEKSHSLSEPATFTNVDRNHKLFDGVFDDKPGSSQIESPKIYKSFPSESGLALISIPGGAFLAESKQREGKMIYIAVSPDPDWSNFPYTGTFPALIYRSLLYLTLSEDLSIDIKSGESLIYKIPTKFANSGTFKIADPSNNDFFKQSVALPQGKVLSLEKMTIPGIYTIFDEKNDYVAQISVNIDETEFNLTPYNNELLTNTLKERIVDTPITILDNIQDLASGINRVRIGTELWQIFIILALLCAIAEMLVQRISKNDLAPGK